MSSSTYLFSRETSVNCALLWLVTVTNWGGRTGGQIDAWRFRGIIINKVCSGYCGWAYVNRMPVKRKTEETTGRHGECVSKEWATEKTYKLPGVWFMGMRQASGGVNLEAIRRWAGNGVCMQNVLPCRRTYANFRHVQTCCNLIKIKIKITNTRKYAENENVVQVLDTNWRRLVARLFTGSARQTKSNSRQPEAKYHSNHPSPPSQPDSRRRRVGCSVQLSRVIWGQPHSHLHACRIARGRSMPHAACRMQHEWWLHPLSCSLSLPFSLSVSYWQTAGGSKPRRLNASFARESPASLCCSCIFATSILTSTHTKPKAYYIQVSVRGSTFEGSTQYYIRLSSYAYLHTPHGDTFQSINYKLLSEFRHRSRLEEPLSYSFRGPFVRYSTRYAPSPSPLLHALPVSIAVPLVRCLPTPTITININHIYPKRKCFLLQWRSQKIHTQQGNLLPVIPCKRQAESGQLV